MTGNIVATVRVARIETLFAFPREQYPTRPCIELVDPDCYTAYWPLVPGATEPLPPMPDNWSGA